MLIKNLQIVDFLSSTVDRNLPATAGDMGLIPRLGRFHMSQATKPKSRNFESAHLQPVLHNKRSHHGKKLEHRNEE